MTTLLEILALMRQGKWNEAHNLVQFNDSSTTAWLHALLHVQEGDLENAEYWYGKSGPSIGWSTLRDVRRDFQTALAAATNS